MAILLTVGIVLGILWFPVKGEKNNEIWLSSDTYRLEDTVVLQKGGKGQKPQTIAVIFQHSDYRCVFGKFLNKVNVVF